MMNLHILYKMIFINDPNFENTIDVNIGDVLLFWRTNGEQG